MDISYIKKLIKLVENSSIDELELEEEGKRIKVGRNKKTEIVSQFANYSLPQAPTATGSAVQTQVEKPVVSPVQVTENKYHEVRSPIVGTFYRAPAPDAAPYVEVGQSVKVGTIMCIVEAMKLMNEIESDCDGKVVKIVAENGKPVEYNQVLFLVEKA